MLRKARRILVVILLIGMLTDSFGMLSDGMYTGDTVNVEATDKYSLTIDVTSSEYGAKSGSDSYKAIQKALDAAAQAGTKDNPALVKIPKGTYYISATLCIGSNTILSLDSQTVIKKAKGAKILYMLRAASDSKNKLCKTGGFSDTCNITVKGGVWDAEYIKYSETSGGSLFFFVHTNNLTISKVELRNNFGTHLIELAGVKNVKIANCKLHGFKGPEEDTDKEAIQLDYCHAESTLSSGAPFDDSACVNVTVKECEIYDYPRAIGSHMAVKGIYHTGLKIVSNKIHDITAAAIYGYNYATTTISGNTIKNVQCGIQIKTYSKVTKTMQDRLSGVSATKLSKGKTSVTIKENTIITNKAGTDLDEGDGGAMAIFIYGAEGYEMNTVTISSNKLTSDSSGVYLRYVNNATIASNTINRHDNAFDVSQTKNSEDAIKLLTCKNAVIKKNKIATTSASSFENGIALRENCTGAKAVSNTVNKSSDSGIALYTNCTLTARDNTISDSGAHGIQIKGASKVSLTGGKITNSGENGINVGNDSTLECSETVIASGKGKGINVMAGATLDAAQTEINGNQDAGIRINDNCTATVTGCIVSGNGGKGINIGAGSRVTVSASTITDNGDNALQIKASEVIITDNVVTGNCKTAESGKAFMIFEGAKGSIANNTISNPLATYEIYISDGSGFKPIIGKLKRSAAPGTKDAAGNIYQ